MKSNIYFLFVFLLSFCLAKDSFAQSTKAKISFNQALDQHRNRNYAAAVGHLKDAIEDSPNFQEAYRLLADCYDEDNRVGEAITTYEKVLKMDPNQDKVLYNLARLYISEKRYAEAEQNLQTAVNINPNYQRAKDKLSQLRQYMTENSLATTATTTTQPSATPPPPTNNRSEVEAESEKYTPPTFEEMPKPSKTEEKPVVATVEPTREEFKPPTSMDTPSKPVVPDVSPKKVTESDLLVFWADPDPVEVDFKSFSVAENFIDVKLKTVNDKELKTSNFKVYINGVAQQGARPEGEQVSAPVAERGDKLTQTYRNRIYLTEGINKIEVRVVKPSGEEVPSEVIHVKYLPDLPNLHVLAIGPKHSDLKYTTKDAEDFVASVESQKGALFKNINITKLVGKQDATDNDIRKGVIDMLLKFQIGEISERDVLVLFISSHGKNIKGKFKLLPSNYDKKYEDIYAIDFQDDIINHLNKINCKKLILVDACHSGAADGKGSKSDKDKELSKALTDLLKMAAGTSTIASCQSDQLSYEDDAWQNGAFTESILDAFANKTCNDSKGEFAPDADKNGIVTLAELYAFLKRRVPNLVKQQKPNAITDQTPLMSQSQLDDKMPLFMVK